MLHHNVDPRRQARWQIPGTEDLKPYIPAKRHLMKWVGTCIGFPLLAAVVSGVMALVK